MVLALIGGERGEEIALGRENRILEQRY